MQIYRYKAQELKCRL